MQKKKVKRQIFDTRLEIKSIEFFNKESCKSSCFDFRWYLPREKHVGRRGWGASICASCFCDASAYSRRMRVRSAGCTHAYIGRLAADVLAFGIAPHIIQGCTKCLAICKRDTLVRRCRCCCVAGVARRRPSLIPACSGPVTGRVPTPLSPAKWDKYTFSITLLNNFQKFK